MRCPGSRSSASPARRAGVVTFYIRETPLRAGVSSHFLHSRPVAGGASGPRWGLTAEGGG